MPTPSRFPQPTRLLSAIAIALLALGRQAAAQQADAGMARVAVSGSSIKRLASENALPLTTIKGEELLNRGLTTMSDVATSSYIDTNALPSEKPGQPFYNEIAPYILYNLSANDAWNKRLKFSVGVNNLLDADSPLSNQRLSSRVVFAQNIAKPIGRAYNVRANYTF
ncbi:TonB-dependent receptor [Massilia atriviolacea]|uniref:TonB-dependent receptor n=1 Tax=Massilia atriviolacea TaxID=2495579 RepID=A0A430HHB3_9BURK|nr:TonB-dependent receptor [Massilia atriviolacea]RSZ56892.1 TonB-dependent receptor [Massilia atriviolacea]